MSSLADAIGAGNSLGYNGSQTPAGSKTGTSQSTYGQQIGAQDQAQQAYQAALANWQAQQRQPYYSAISQGYQQAGAGQAQDQYRQAQLQQRYGMLRQGNAGGSADFNGQHQIQQQYAQQLGGLNAQGNQLAQQQQGVDTNQMAQWYSQFMANPALQAQYQSELAASQARAGMAPQLAQAQQGAQANAMYGQGLVSGAMGQSLSGFGNLLSQVAQSGYFNQPQGYQSSAPIGVSSAYFNQMPAGPAQYVSGQTPFGVGASAYYGGG